MDLLQNCAMDLEVAAITSNDVMEFAVSETATEDILAVPTVVPHV